MQENCGNIYRDARKTAGLTQERWAELLGLSVEAVRQYETGKISPSDEVVLRMAEAAGQWILCYWHLSRKSRVAGDILPEVRERPLPEAVLNLMVRINDFSRHGLEDLTRLAADGKISQEEVLAFGDVLSELRELVAAAYEVEYAGQG